MTTAKTCEPEIEFRYPRNDGEQIPGGGKFCVWGIAEDVNTATDTVRLVVTRCGSSVGTVHQVVQLSQGFWAHSVIVDVTSETDEYVLTATVMRGGTEIVSTPPRPVHLVPTKKKM